MEKPWSGALSIFAKRELLYGENLWQILSLPLRIFFSGQDDNPQLFDGVLTPILIILLPWTFKGKWLEDKKLLARFALIFLAYAVFLVDMRIRYILPLVPALVVLAVYGVFNIYLRIRRPAVVFAGLICLAVMAWVLSLAVRERSNSASISKRLPKSGCLLERQTARVHFTAIYQWQHRRVRENLSSLYRTESVLLREGLFSRRR